MRKVSAPQRSTYVSGFTTLPRDFDIFAPSLTIMPWARKRRNGSSNGTNPMSCRAIVTKRAYIRCRTACSLPPMYDATGSHLRVSSGSNATSSRFAEG